MDIGKINRAVAITAIIAFWRQDQLNNRSDEGQPKQLTTLIQATRYSNTESNCYSIDTHLQVCRYLFRKSVASCFGT